MDASDEKGLFIHPKNRAPWQPDCSLVMKKDHNNNGSPPKTAMLVASAGGHWVQLTRLVPAFAGCRLVFVTTKAEYTDVVAPHRLITVPDASRWNKARVLLLAGIMLKHTLAVRPDIIISTGAAPGFFALYFGKKLGAKTIWLDSIANSETLSMSGRMAGKYADLWLTQWEHLAKPDGPYYAGAVL